MNITRERCTNHASREAVARCPECGRFFCRECISEHEGRVSCASCLRHFSEKPVRHNPLVGVARAAQVLVGILLLWSSFYLLGRALLTIPSSFHNMAIQGEDQENP